MLSTFSRTVPSSVYEAWEKERKKERVSEGVATVGEFGPDEEFRITDRVDQKSIPERNLHSPDKIIVLQVHVNTETSVIHAFFRFMLSTKLLWSALKHLGTAIGIVSMRVYFHATLFSSLCCGS